MRQATPILCTNFTRSHSVLLSWLVSAPTGNSFQIEGDSNLNIINTKEGNHKGPQQHLSRKKKRYPRRGPGISASWNARTCLNRTATLQIARNGDGTWLYIIWHRLRPQDPSRSAGQPVGHPKEHILFSKTLSFKKQTAWLAGACLHGQIWP